MLTARIHTVGKQMSNPLTSKGEEAGDILFGEKPLRRRARRKRVSLNTKTEGSSNYLCSWGMSRKLGFRKLPPFLCTPWLGKTTL